MMNFKNLHYFIKFVRVLFDILEFKNWNLFVIYYLNIGIFLT